MRFFDFPTLVLIIGAGFQLGFLGVFGWDAAGAVLGDHKNFLFALMGLSALWQFFRQRFH